MWGMQPARQMSFPPRMEDGVARSARSKAATTLESAVSEAPNVPMEKLLLKWLFFFFGGVLHCERLGPGTYWTSLVCHRG